MSIVSHVSVGSTEEKLAEMIKFYDAVMPEVGAKRAMAIDRSGVDVAKKGTGGSDADLVAVAYGKYWPEFWVGLPENKQPASAGNGVHVAFMCTSRKQVDRVYEAAIRAGGTDNGPPGPRPQYSDKYYGGFFLDPCGNKLEATFYDTIFNYCVVL
jgi:hypothetical protein